MKEQIGLSSPSSSGPPAIQPAPSSGSLAYSMDTETMERINGGNAREEQQQQQQQQPQPPPRLQQAPTAESLDYSIYSSGEMSAEQYYAQTHSQYNQYQEQAVDPRPPPQQHGLPPAHEPAITDDATPTVHEMHRKLLYLLSHPELFTRAIEWQSKVDRGLDPSRPTEEDDAGVDGIRSFDNEFHEEQSLATTTAAAEEHKDEGAADEGGADRPSTGAIAAANQAALIPPLPLQIFAADAEVVLPQALTASQLFGIERVTGIELEAAAGAVGLAQLFLRWLALMPEGNHENVISPPGLTVMRISGGRYRVTGAHRVVWRWMNKFSPASLFAERSDSASASAGAGASLSPTTDAEGAGAELPPDTDFDFGDLVTMTVIDVFETDAAGRLLSYCPTFDNRAVHKTREATERLRQGASRLRARTQSLARSPAGQSVNKAAGSFGKMSLSAAFAMGNIVKTKIEEELHKHQHPEPPGEDAGSDTAGGDDGEGDVAPGGGDGRAAAVAPGGRGAPRGEGYSSDEGSPGRRLEV